MHPLHGPMQSRNARPQARQRIAKAVEHALRAGSKGKTRLIRRLTFSRAHALTTRIQFAYHPRAQTQVGLQPRQHPEMESLAPSAPSGWEGTVASVFLSLAPIWLFGIVTGYMVSGAATPLRSGCNSQGTRLKVGNCTGRSCRGLAPSTCPTCCCLARACGTRCLPARARSSSGEHSAAGAVVVTAPTCGKRTALNLFAATHAQGCVVLVHRASHVSELLQGSAGVLLHWPLDF